MDDIPLGMENSGFEMDDFLRRLVDAVFQLRILQCEKGSHIAYKYQGYDHSWKKHKRKPKYGDIRLVKCELLVYSGD